MLASLVRRVQASAEERSLDVSASSAARRKRPAAAAARAALSRQPWERQGLTRAHVDSPAFRTTRAAANAAKVDVAWEQERAIVQAVGRDVAATQIYVVYGSVLRLREITAAAAAATAARDRCQSFLSKVLAPRAVTSFVAKHVSHRQLRAWAARVKPHRPCE